MTSVPSHRLKARKRALRREVLAARDALAPGDRHAWSERIADRLLGLPELEGVGTVLAFWSFGSEVETGPLIERLVREGRTVALPRIEDREVAAVTYRPGDAVRPTSFGAAEPVEGRVLGPAELDLVVVPGVAFDRSGGRVGYGGGYYDRLLARRRPGVPAVAVAFWVQLVPEVPAGRGDLRVDAIVTEREVVRCR
jgi:5-formyltetrahydrofolate cyclo-ligase